MADAYRVDLVQQLAQKIAMAQECLRSHRLKSSKTRRRRINSLFGILGPVDDEAESDPTGSLDADMDADADILRAFQQTPESRKTGDAANSLPGDDKASPNGQSSAVDSPLSEATHQPSDSSQLTDEALKVADSQKTMRGVREYLPQLVSAVLKSPHPVDPSVANPIYALRQLLLNRCLQDPSWGIELCWLLEADVGRAWKTLLEHPQQTGRRLLVILPAEKAAVLAKIGIEKRAAFDLLQDVEQATAYGYNADTDDATIDASSVGVNQDGTPFIAPPEPRLPSSLSQRRCAHFGDTMHFVDRLTKLSNDLRKVPIVDRETYMLYGLRELNRRIRRRMITKGELSLDVEDNCGPDDWPRVEDLRIDMLQHSVHFPLAPQTGTWHTGEEDYEPSRDDSQVVRVLNIVADESRLLSSRERCPFLIHLEVADTGLEGHDARLYTSGAASTSVGSTVEEALSMNIVSQQSASMPKPQERGGNENLSPNAAYGISQDLVSSTPPQPPRKLDLPRGGSLSDQPYSHQPEDQASADFAQGNQDYTSDHSYYPQQQHVSYEHASHQYHDQVGYQSHESNHGHIAYENENGAFEASDRSDAFQQDQLEHQQTQGQWYGQEMYHPNNQIAPPEPPKTIGKELLDKVFGTPWAQKCKEIKQTSHFGKVQGWRLAAFIMKAGEDIRKESLVMQVIAMMRNWFDEEIPAAFRPAMRLYTIMSVGGDAGLVECLSDSTSVDEVKKKTDGFASLRDFFERAFGPPGTPALPGQVSFEEAQDNFLRSLVGYSLVCFILQIKDRHNANILMDRDGHIMHIDFGFVLGDTPKMARVPLFYERAPFKLSAEFWDVLGGWNTKTGGLGVKFCKMFEMAFECASNHVEEIATLVETTMMGLNYDPRTAKSIANEVRARLRMRGPPGSLQQKQFIVEIVSLARASLGTSTYDWLQKSMNGYL